MKFELYLLVLVGLIAVCAAAIDDSSSSSSNSEDTDDGNDAIPSMLGMLGSKIAAAENWDVEYDDSEIADSERPTTRQAPAAPCCFPNVWQGRVYSDFGFAPIGGRGGRRSGDDDDDSDGDDDYDKKGKKKDGRRGGRATVSRALDQVFVDGDNKRVAGNLLEYHGGPRTLNISYIFLYGANNTGDLYLFCRKAQKCRHRQMRGVVWRRQCIPANATNGGQYSLGPATGGLTVQSWMFEGGSKRADAVLESDDGGVDALTTTHRPRPRPRPRPRMHVAANVLVLPDSCVPIVIQEEGAVFSGRRPRDDDDVDNQDDDDDDRDFRTRPSPRPKPSPRPRPWSRPRGEAFVGSAYFSGLQTSISDPSVFNIPSYCKKSANTLYYDEMEDELPASLERFILL